MALSTKKRNQIIADIKSKRFKTKTALYKHYKIDKGTYYKIEKEITTSNADIVELGVEYELMKKSTKNPQEILSIEKTVKERISTVEIDNQIVEKNRKIIEDLQSVVEDTIKEDDLKPQDIKALAGSVKDFESVANPRDNGKVEVNTQVNTQINEIKVTFE